MRRLEPAAALALPPIAGFETVSDGTGWSFTERRTWSTRRSHITAMQKSGARSARGASSTAVRAVESPTASPKNARARSLSPGKVGSHDTSPRRVDAVAPPIASEVPPTMTPPAPPPIPTSPEAPNPDGQKHGGMKGRAVESWLNSTLGQAGSMAPGDQDGAAANVASAHAKRLQGLSMFGIDAAALEKLGLDVQASERVYRAMYVYSQGLHAVLQEAIGKSKNSSQALLVLWRAFTAVLETTGQKQEQGSESLAALVQRGNEEEKARMQKEYHEQVTSLQAYTQKLTLERKALQDELTRVGERETRLYNESEGHKSAHQTAVSKLEREIKQRVDAEVRFLDKSRWASALQEDLNKERAQGLQVQSQLAEANATRESLQVELDNLRLQVKTQDAQISNYKQAALEAAQQRQRHEQQVAQHKHNIERMGTIVEELKEQLEAEADGAKRLSEQLSACQREVRKLETQYEDEAHARKEVQNERDILREKIDRLDNDLLTLTEERRQIQKENSDYSMAHRTNVIELKRKTEQLERIESQHEKLTTQHRALLDTHRALSVEADNMKEDLKHLDEQLRKETDLRKQLQTEKKAMKGQIAQLQAERDTHKLAVQGTERELREATEKSVKIESVVRDTKYAMQKINLQHQTENKAHAQKVAMLEKVIADERKERRNLVTETQQAVEKREEALEKLKHKTHENQDLKRQRLEKEEECDRLKVLLKAQEHRNTEQLVTVDKYQAVVANHEAEMRQMQVLLECERKEARRQLQEMQIIQDAARKTMEDRVEHWKMSFEDVFSRLNFNPATKLINYQTDRIDELTSELAGVKLDCERHKSQVVRCESELNIQSKRVGELEAAAHEDKQKLIEQTNKAKASTQLLERESMARNDAECKCERILVATAGFDTEREILESKIVAAVSENERLVALMTKSTKEASVQVQVQTAKGGCQTDLSYQYLESTDRQSQERWMRERMDTLKQASDFLEDGDLGRDFTKGRARAPSIFSMGGTDALRLPQGAKVELQQQTMGEEPDGRRRSSLRMAVGAQEVAKGLALHVAKRGPSKQPDLHAHRTKRGSI
eukprot:TRINITY_DN28869_c0_g1_i1.p1 TRINITY_DN28869_c0_g1~~TRINITY_DN28869_c0_g1_i1.p1  ORF type:complete len:1069 (-),score=203.19 TRINITY_DN28869_c0_g1_i1:281-3487(-)